MSSNEVNDGVSVFMGIAVVFSFVGGVTHSVVIGNRAALSTWVFFALSLIAIHLLYRLVVAAESIAYES